MFCINHQEKLIPVKRVAAERLLHHLLKPLRHMRSFPRGCLSHCSNTATSLVRRFTPDSRSSTFQRSEEHGVVGGRSVEIRGNICLLWNELSAPAGRHPFMEVTRFSSSCLLHPISPPLSAPVRTPLPRPRPHLWQRVAKTCLAPSLGPSPFPSPFPAPASLSPSSLIHNLQPFAEQERVKSRKQAS